MNYFILYLILVNLSAFAVMYKDKHAARKHKWRTPEATLLFIATALGSPGILAGMYILRHKTKHMKFVLYVPIVLIAQIYLLYKFFI